MHFVKWKTPANRPVYGANGGVAEGAGGRKTQKNGVAECHAQITIKEDGGISGRPRALVVLLSDWAKLSAVAAMKTTYFKYIYL